MKIPPEVLLEVRSFFENLSGGTKCSFTIHTNGDGAWSKEVLYNQKILVASGFTGVQTLDMRTVLRKNSDHLRDGALSS